MKAKIAAITIIGLLTLSVIAVGFSAVGDVQSNPSEPLAQSGQETGDTAAVSAFKFVCPFH